ncbi:MAG: hypothetical protein M5Z89_21015, partial [Olivibacter sp.]|nr:hypothetical protein [Olivibacter sp. UJ_SKK_5.1]
CSCTGSDHSLVPIKGTWKLLSATVVTDKDSVTTDYSKGTSMIKIINDSHFAFLRHDENTPKDSSHHFDAGGGRYTLKGNAYTEYLDFYANRNWEGNTFNFQVTILNDTLVQKGTEKVESEGINREIIERYVRVQ